MEAKCESMREKSTRLPWFICKLLALFYVLVTLFTFYKYPQYFERKYYDIYQHMLWVEYMMTFIFFVACLGVIARRPWAVNWIKITGVWLLAVLWSHTPALAQNTFEEILYGPPIFLGGGSYLANRTNPSYVYLLARVVGLLCLLLFIQTSRVISKGWVKVNITTEGKGRAIERTNGIFLWMGVLIILLGSTFKWLDVHIEQQIYAMTIGSYLVVAGVAILLIWHVIMRKYFFAASAIGFSAILFVYKPIFGSPLLTIVLWLAALVLSVVCLFQSHYNNRLRIAVVAVPIIFIFVLFFPSFGAIPTYMRFYTYYKPTSKRPINFPEYLQPYPSANDVRYCGGSRAYLSFTVEEPYPALKTLDFIFNKLEQSGWKKLDYDLMNPGLKSSHLVGWFNPSARWFTSSGEVGDKSKKLRPCCWDAYWINDKNTALHVMLEYELAANIEEALIIVHCQLSIQPDSIR